MSFGEKFISSENQRNKLSSQEKEAPDYSANFINEQLAEAIAIEDYKQAAVLRDFIEYRQKYSIKSEIEMLDLLTLEDGHRGKMSLDDPKYRAWEGIEEKRNEARWSGKEDVNDSNLAQYLNSSFESAKSFNNRLQVGASKLNDKKGPEKVDSLLRLYRDKEEIKHFVDLAKEKLDQIWQPYREEANLLDQEYTEYNSSYTKYELSPEQLKELDNIPDSVREPVEYWQKIYDNSRIILDGFDKAIDELR